MYDQYVGEIRTFAGDYAPKGWAFCDGQLLWPDDYQALYAVIGSLYGRDGAYFRLPDLRGRLAVDMGVGYPLAARGGTETVTLLPEQLPPHTHQVYASSAEGTTPRSHRRRLGCQPAQSIRQFKHRRLPFAHRSGRDRRK